MNTKKPLYTKGEEIFNLSSHIVGGTFGIFVLALFLILSNNYNSLELISLIIYGVSIILLYTISSIYHGLKPSMKSKRVLRILDHCSIYILIAGTYTPICVFAFNGIEGNIILGLEWTLAISGIILNALWLNKKPVKIISMILYAVTGWMLIFFPSAIKCLTNTQFLFILFGGVVYTIGILFYALGKKKKWSHSIFHILCVVATVLQFIGILLLTK